MNFDKRKRALLVLAMIIAFSTFIYAYADSANREEYEGIIRFHVKAESNSEEDQLLKLKVRDAVLEEINNELISETVSAFKGDGNSAKLSIEETRAALLEFIPEIEKTAKRVIEEEGFDYDVRAELDVTWIPKKTYGEVVFPAGNYEALTITIGEGKGDNWWCVLFPPLCIIDPEGKTLESASFEEKELSGFGENDYGIVLKFKTLERINSK